MINILAYFSSTPIVNSVFQNYILLGSYFIKQLEIDSFANAIGSKRTVQGHKKISICIE